ncbi:hypothetical protein J4Q44_G00193340 [Coregonus suidteri]|uniref:Uncharacterized protein n=1 Tax=Coregonus suidteri TaxID=861788 RepID=A0AAN8LKA3_9TELE
MQLQWHRESQPGYQMILGYYAVTVAQAVPAWIMILGYYAVTGTQGVPAWISNDIRILCSYSGTGSPSLDTK